jgi:hypothetical protein
MIKAKNIGIKSITTESIACKHIADELIENEQPEVMRQVYGAKCQLEGNL